MVEGDGAFLKAGSLPWEVHFPDLPRAEAVWPPESENVGLSASVGTGSGEALRRSVRNEFSCKSENLTSRDLNI